LIAREPHCAIKITERPASGLRDFLPHGRSLEQRFRT